MILRRMVFSSMHSRAEAGSLTASVEPAIMTTTCERCIEILLGMVSLEPVGDAAEMIKSIGWLKLRIGYIFLIGFTT